MHKTTGKEFTVIFISCFVFDEICLPGILKKKGKRKKKQCFGFVHK